MNNFHKQWIPYIEVLTLDFLLLAISLNCSKWNKMKATNFYPLLIHSFQCFLVNGLTPCLLNKTSIYCNINAGPLHFIVIRFHYDLLETKYTIHKVTDIRWNHIFQITSVLKTQLQETDMQFNELLTWLEPMINTVKK